MLPQTPRRVPLIYEVASVLDGIELGTVITRASLMPAFISYSPDAMKAVLRQLTTVHNMLGVALLDRLTTEPGAPAEWRVIVNCADIA